MGGNSKGGPSNQQLETSQAGLATQLTSLMGQQQGESSQLFNLAFPGMQQSEQFSQALASGSPNLIAAITSPAAQQISQQAAGAKQNILNTSPSGGERNLALENVDVAQGAQLGQVATQGWANAFNSLAQMGQSGVGLGQGAAGAAIGAGGEANSINSNLIQEHMQQKGQTLGMYGSIGQQMASGFGGGLGASAGGASGKGSAAAGLMAFGG